MKRNILLWLLLGLSVILVITGYVFDHQSQPDPGLYFSDAEPHIDVAVDEEKIFLVGSVVEEWTNWETGAKELYSEYRTHGSIYTDRPVILHWGIFDIPNGTFIRKQYLELATSENFENARRYDLRSGDRRMKLQRLLVDTQYYFRIATEFENGQSCIAEGTFTTAWSPRIIVFENLRNIRDIGGWKTENEKVIKQGLLYRGSELDGATVKNCVATPLVVDTMVNELNIKSELDLRSADTKGVRDLLGTNVKHQYFALPSYAGAFTDEGNQKLRRVFGALALKDNYPVYLHCTKGADQTGIVCFLLEALLGVSEENCYREWELSTLDTGSDKREEMDRFVETLRKYEGNTLQEKTENYLRSIGVTQEEIDSIRSILVG